VKLQIYIIRILLSSIVLLCCSNASIADVTKKDVSVITRIVGLLENGPKGVVEVAVISGDPSVKSDVDAFSSIAESSEGAAGVKLRPVPVSYTSLASTNAKLLFIPEGISQANLEKIFEIAKRLKIVTISTSTECVESQKCAISISSSPAVDVRLSVSAAAATNVSFGTTFRMIIKEVR
jgi:hypothetical protein